MVAQKPWKRFSIGYNTEKMQQPNANEPWLMLSLTRHKLPTFSFIFQPKFFNLLKLDWFCSGGRIQITILDSLTMILAKKAGDGAGRNAGLLLDHGRNGIRKALPPSRKSNLRIRGV